MIISMNFFADNTDEEYSYESKDCDTIIECLQDIKVHLTKLKMNVDSKERELDAVLSNLKPEQN